MADIDKDFIVKKYKFRRKLRRLIKNREEDRKKFYEGLEPPRYDEVYRKGMEWLNSL
jgi:hypothetical protein